MRVRDKLAPQVCESILLNPYAGASWLDGLDDLVYMMALIWRIKFVGSFEVSQEYLEFDAETHSGLACVLRLYIPDESEGLSFMRYLDEFQKNRCVRYWTGT